MDKTAARTCAAITLSDDITETVRSLRLAQHTLGDIWERTFAEEDSLASMTPEQLLFALDHMAPKLEIISDYVLACASTLSALEALAEK